MQDNIFTTTILPLALALIMLGVSFCTAAYFTPVMLTTIDRPILI